LPKPKNIRSRVISEKEWPATLDQRYNQGPWVPATPTPIEPVRVSGKQYTVSEGHFWPPRKGEVSLVDRGGEFYTTKQVVLANPRKHTIVDGDPYGVEYRYIGYPMPIYPYPDMFPSTAESSDSALDIWGTSIVAKVEPTNSAADASTFLAELYRDGLPSLIGHTLWSGLTKKALKSTAEEYLNLAFGWLPMVNDIRKFSNAIQHANQVLDQYEKDSGKLVRRHRSAPTKRSSVMNIINDSTPFVLGNVAGGVNPGPYGVAYRTLDTVRDMSFAGAFTYYLPSDYDSRNRLRELAGHADKLLGLDLSPESIWNATPWSWAVDWFSNTGDVIHNIDAFGNNGLVMPYGYVTERVTVTATFSNSNRFIRPGMEVAPFKVFTQTQKRRKANPFGFGLTWDGLSSFQKSILVALGITRSH